MMALLAMFCLTACQGYSAATPNLSCPDWPPAPKNPNITQKDVAIWIETQVYPAFVDCKAVLSARDKI